MSHSIDVPADLYQQALEIAQNTATTVNEVAAKLMRDGLQRLSAAEQTVAKGGKIATFDTGLASSHSDVAVLIPKELPGSATCELREPGGAAVPTCQSASAPIQAQ